MNFQRLSLMVQLNHECRMQRLTNEVLRLIRASPWIDTIAHRACLSNAFINKCRPILVQGLRRDIEINFHIKNIIGSVAQSVQWRPVEQEVRDLKPALGKFKKIYFIYMRKWSKWWRTTTTRKNSSNYLVFGRWPQTKIVSHIIKLN